MSVLSKLTVKSVTRANKQNPLMQRRLKLAVAVDEQLKVAEAAIKGEHYEVQRRTWAKNDYGDSVLVERMRKVRPWFFEQDGGWYVQCKYGNKPLALGKGNAVFVKALKDVQGALTTLKAAIDAGELDEAISEAVQRKKAK
ncbi:MULTISPECIES: hypothetical protein [unclassified Ruegeria]|uniref:hypothetical protein n=1 Tax=unclassified Ruegeria TaxID=2625375 RepID=UPI001488E591|nr:MULTISPECIES: hypothetical protein [unclassified Ruegeria]